MWTISGGIFLWKCMFSWQVRQLAWSKSLHSVGGFALLWERVCLSVHSHSRRKRTQTPIVPVCFFRPTILKVPHCWKKQIKNKTKKEKKRPASFDVFVETQNARISIYRNLPYSWGCDLQLQAWKLLVLSGRMLNLVFFCLEYLMQCHLFTRLLSCSFRKDKLGGATHKL